jgi:hypothetical protein
VTLFEALDGVLAQESSIDYWADHGIDQAQSLISQMLPQDWASLSSQWRGRPQLWQMRLADALSAAPPDRAVPILLEMIQSTDDELAQTALESLDTFAPRAVVEVINPEIIRKLKTLASRRSGMDAETITDFLARLQAKI